MSGNHIQVLCYREKIDRDTGKPYIGHTKLDPEASSIVSLFKNIDKVISVIPEEQRWNCHYTLANCTQFTGKNLREFAYQETLAFDLDGIDTNRLYEYIEVFFNTVNLDRSCTSIVSSGHGLHFITAMKKRVESVDQLNKLKIKYTTLCGEINTAIFNAGLSGNADPIIWSEKKTLRLPNTINRKKDMEDTMCTLIENNIDYQDFDIEDIITFEADVEGGEDTSHYVVDTQAVLDGCEFLKFCRNNPNKVSEPQWRSMLSILQKIPMIGEKLCHEYSSGYSGYDHDETETKIDQIRGLTGPHSCKTVEINYPHCNACPHYMKCNNPLQIKSASFIATESTGFHTVKRDSKGILKPDKPCYTDLVEYFVRKNPYVVNSRDRDLYVFNGTHWSIMREIEVDNFATKHFSPTATNLMRSEFRGLLYSRNIVPPEFFESSTFGKLNLANGILDIKTRTLSPHSMDFGFTHVLPYDYNPNATCANFLKLLTDITLRDEELQQILLEYIGYIISGIDPAWGSKALILVGEGQNGKSTFINILRQLVGRNNYSTVNVKSFSDSNSVYGMVNKLLNVCEEESYDSLRDSTAFKNIVSGGETTIKQLYKEKYTAKIMCKVVVGCNAIPPTNDQSNATYRRLLIVPFDAVFSAENGNLDKNIVSKVQAELSGILNVVLVALDELLKNKDFTESRAAMNALKAYRMDNDLIGGFLRDNYIEDAEGMVYNKDVMSDFQEWRRENNIRADYDMRAMAKRLSTVFPKSGKSRDSKGRLITGVRKINAEDLSNF